MLNTVFGSLSVGVTPSTSSYESIATVTVGSGGSSNITFSSIPSTYTHLQIRSIHAINSGGQSVNIRFNSDTGNNYAYHQLYGDGSAAYGDAGTTRSSGLISYSNQASGSSFSAFVVDVLDYRSTSKYKTIRSLTGTESNNTGKTRLGLGSPMMRITSSS